MDERHFFPKTERLFLQKEIDQLFDSGQSFISYPLRIIFLSFPSEQATTTGISVFISVPKKRIRHAVNRNRIKRLIREAFRLNKNLYRQEGKKIHIAYIYICKEMKTYACIEKAVQKAFVMIAKRI